MPFTQSFPFKRIAVDHSVRGTSRVWWECERNFHDPEPHSFQLQVSMTGTQTATDWEDVGSPSPYGNMAEDDQFRLHGKMPYTHYRIKLTTPARVYVSNPASILGGLSSREWHIAREIVRKETLRHKIVSHRGFLLKRIRFGEACPLCLDPLTGENTDSYCPQCNGVGFKHGYHPPIPLCMDLSPQSFQEERSSTNPTGGKLTNIVQARVLGMPLLGLEDVWVDGISDQRWALHTIKHDAAWRGLPLITSVELRLIPTSHQAYRVNVGGQPVATNYYPTAGCGSVSVTHDFGGTDVLAYQNSQGCGIGGATVLAIPYDRYEEGHRTASDAVAATFTAGDGRWQDVLKLDPGVYAIVFELPGKFGPDTARITVQSSESSQSVLSSSIGEFGV